MRNTVQQRVGRYKLKVTPEDDAEANFNNGDNGVQVIQ